MGANLATSTQIRIPSQVHSFGAGKLVRRIKFVFFAYPPPWLATLAVTGVFGGLVRAVRGWGGTLLVARAPTLSKQKYF